MKSSPYWPWIAMDGEAPMGSGWYFLIPETHLSLSPLIIVVHTKLSSETVVLSWTCFQGRPN